MNKEDKLRAENQRLRSALQDIADPLAKFQREADESGGEKAIDGRWAFELSRDANYLKQLAREALK